MCEAGNKFDWLLLAHTIKSLISAIFLAQSGPIGHFFGKMTKKSLPIPKRTSKEPKLLKGL